MRGSIMMSLLVIPLFVGCVKPPPSEAPVETPTAKAPPADPTSVTERAPRAATGLLDADVPSQLQTATFALG